jgi:hypothetical protein
MPPQPLFHEQLSPETHGLPSLGVEVGHVGGGGGGQSL